MLLTTKGRYAIMAMLEMYQNSSEGKVISIKSMAEKQNLSVYYLEQLFSKLKKRGIVNSIKGPGGGYVFSKTPDQIILLDILKAVGEQTKTVKCDALKLGSCTGESELGKCNSHLLWLDFSLFVEEYFSKTTLEDVKKGDFFYNRIFKNNL